MGWEPAWVGGGYGRRTFVVVFVPPFGGEGETGGAEESFRGLHRCRFACDEGGNGQARNGQVFHFYCLIFIGGSNQAHE